jgi:HK97 gp10 family phage protein
MADPRIEVDGVKELQRLLRKVESKEINKAIRSANKSSANVIAEEAKTIVPVRSGRLQRSIKAQGSQSSGSVKAGSAARVPYAGVIHFGWPERNIKAQPFLERAVTSKLPEARTVYADLMYEVMRVIESTNFR